MPKTIEITRPLKIERLTRVMRVKGVDVSLHWSVLLIAALILCSGFRRPVMAVVGLSAYLSVLLIHECGHLLAAHQRRCAVFGIELYPIFAITRFETPWSRFDHCIIAWGGVLAQALVALPLVAWVAVFGYTPFEPVNLVLALLGFFSLGVAAFNLLPIAPLDGITAWGLIPALIDRARHSSRPGWRGRP
jgi:stage IV sporulation protein FB